MGPKRIDSSFEFQRGVFAHIATEDFAVIADLFNNPVSPVFIQAKRFTIESSGPLELWADGERIGRTPVTIEAVPDAVRVMVP